MNEASFSMNFKAVTEGGLRAQITVRGENVKDFETHFKEILKFMEDNKVQTEVQAATNGQQGEDKPPTKDWCMVHDCQMEQRKTKDGSRVFYSHKTTDERYNNNPDYDSWFCSGKEPK